MLPFVLCTRITSLLFDLSYAMVPTVMGPHCHALSRETRGAGIQLPIHDSITGQRSGVLPGDGENRSIPENQQQYGESGG